MRLTRTFCALAGISAVALALPPTKGGPRDAAPEKKQAGGRIVQVAAGPLPPAAQAMKRTYQKYRKQAPSAVIRAAATQTGSVQASNLPFDQAYLSPVTLGNDNVLLDFDTGSSDLWSFSTLLPAADCNNHTCYQLGGTVAPNETWNINYGDGSGASGIVYADKVVVGGVTATVQAVEAATSVSTAFIQRQGDGLLGLGFLGGNTCSPGQCYTFMDHVAPTLPLPIFTATLRKGAPGEYDFGYLDHSKYTGSIAYATVNHTGTGNPAYWEFIATGYAVGGGHKKTYSIDAVADTGTSLVYLDQAIVAAYFAKVPSAYLDSTVGGYIFKCSDAKHLRNLSIYIGKSKRTMPGSYANYAPLSSPAGYCISGVQPNTGIGFSIIGDVFLKSQYVVFDVSVPRVGFAQQAGVTV